MNAVYTRLWFHADDVDIKEKLDRYLGLGLTLCAIEPGLHGAWFWLRPVGTAECQKGRKRYGNPSDRAGT